MSSNKQGEFELKLVKILSEEQKYRNGENIPQQDNQGAILFNKMEENADKQ